MLTGLLLGVLAGLGEVAHLTWFVQGVGFKPTLIAYGMVIDGIVGLAIGAAVGLVSGFLAARRAPRVKPLPATVIVHKVWGSAPAKPSPNTISRRSALRLGLIAGSAAVLGAGALSVAGVVRRGSGGAALAYAPSSAAGERPNILLITLDTIRADFIGAYGDTVTKTPNLDVLAKQSARFDWHMIQEPQTNPSHASMFTGMYPSASGVRIHMVDKLPANLQTLATLLGGAGYATAGLYSWLSLDPQYCDFQRGFQLYQNVAGQKSELLDLPFLRQLGADFRVGEEYFALPREIGNLMPMQQQVQWTDKGRADITTDAAIAQLRTLAGQPFFLWVHYFDAHYPYVPPVGYAEQYSPGYRGPVNNSMDTVDAIQNGKLNPRGADLQELEGLYRGAVTFLDSQLGRLFAALDQLNLGSNTVLALTADHGEAFGEHPQSAEGVDFFHPHSLHNEEQRTPLLLRYPAKLKGGAVVKAPTQAIDLFPTFLELAGVAAPGQSQGTSLVPLLDGRDDGANRAAFASMPDYTFSSVTIPGWKYIQNNPAGSHELFDLNNDPGETRDVSGANPSVVSQLANSTEAWMKAVKIS